MTSLFQDFYFAGFRMPPEHGKVLIGIQESFQSEFLPTANKLHQLGYQVCYFPQTGPRVDCPGLPNLRLIHGETVVCNRHPHILITREMWSRILLNSFRAEIYDKKFEEYCLFIEKFVFIAKRFLNYYR